ncbi:hypothetical protein L210DRAFT_937089 [Boletus edulis BED1]|uniref:Uncharacterized protein n=1 Tax=Boletus edulis BED1 TaxID=1328754 RepID=A0AAD4GLB6_BOLED|nr:hypothetical protein L210DRAFT_937089 [Boletus edulis BED1]
MATPASGTVPSGPNPSAQGWNSLRPGELGSTFRGISRGKSSRGGSVRGGRGGHPPIDSRQKGDSQPDTTNSTPSPSPKMPSASRKPPVSTSTTATSNGTSVKAVNGTAERGGRPKSGSRKQPRTVPAVVVAPPSPSETSQTAPPTPSRSHRRHRAQPGRGAIPTTKPPLPDDKTQKSRSGSTPASQTIMRKDVPPHLAAAHKAEIRHDIDALVERVRSIAMAENRPTTPGSHIDWAGDEDDSLPDLDDWGVTTIHTGATRDKAQSKEISPILVDTLKPLPEPNSEVPQEEEREMETYDSQSERVEESPIKPSFLSSPAQGAMVSSSSEAAPEQCIILPPGAEESQPSTHSDGKLSLRPSLPPKPVVAMESSRGRGSSISKPSSLSHKPPASVAEEAPTTKTEGLSESIHAPSAEERLALERVSSTSSSERGLAVSIHASIPGLPESHSAPSLLSSHSITAPRTHSHSHTESRPPPGTLPHRRGRSGASSPLGRHIYTHARNHSTPAGGAGTRPPHASRPVLTGDAISKLARTIGGLGPAIPVTRDSTISS